MEFEISRASKLYDSNLLTKYERPCKDAFEFSSNVWHIRIDTMEELIHLIAEVSRDGKGRTCDSVIVSLSDITIYDDHVE